MKSLLTCAAALCTVCGIAAADTRVITFEDLAEDFHGESFTHMGVTYRDINLVSGVFPDGDTFGPQVGDEVVIEDATLAYNDFPGWGSPEKALTFGGAFVPGDNLSVGRISSVTMDLDVMMQSASMDILFYENGPWGGIEWHLDALLGGAVVASDTILISDLGGRDNITTDVLSVQASAFDQLHLYARFGAEYSLPRALIDDFTLETVPASGALAAFGLAGMAGLRRRR